MTRFIGLDAHDASCTFAVVGPTGRRIRSNVVETNGQCLVEYLKLIKKPRYLCLEEGNLSRWLYEILGPHVDKITVTCPGEHRGNKSDDIDAFELAHKLRTNGIKIRIYKGYGQYRKLRELVRVHQKVVADHVRTQNRLSCLYRSRGLNASVIEESYPERRLPQQLRTAAKIQRKERDLIAEVRKEAEVSLIAEAKKHPIVELLKSLPGIGTIRATQIVATVINPNRFRRNRQFWAYCGLAIVTRTSSEWVADRDGQWRRARVPMPRGLKHGNRILKNVFKGAASTVIMRSSDEPLYADYSRIVEAGTKPNLAKITIARKLAAIAIAMWKNEEAYNPQKYRNQS